MDVPQQSPGRTHTVKPLCFGLKVQEMFEGFLNPSLGIEGCPVHYHGICIRNGTVLNGGLALVDLVLHCGMYGLLFWQGVDQRLDRVVLGLTWGPRSAEPPCPNR